jgi:hypothetical protein
MASCECLSGSSAHSSHCCADNASAAAVASCLSLCTFKSQNIAIEKKGERELDGVKSGNGKSGLRLFCAADSLLRSLLWRLLPPPAKCR